MLKIFKIFFLHNYASKNRSTYTVNKKYTTLEYLYHQFESKNIQGIATTHIKKTKTKIDASGNSNPPN